MTIQTHTIDGTNLPVLLVINPLLQVILQIVPGLSPRTPGLSASLAPWWNPVANQHDGWTWITMFFFVKSSVVIVHLWLIRIFEWLEVVRLVRFSVFMVKPWLKHHSLWLDPPLGWLKDKPILPYLAVPGGTCDSLQGRHLWSCLATEIGSFHKWRYPKMDGL